MNRIQEQYGIFIESTCRELGWPGLARPLREGFDLLYAHETAGSAMMEGMTPGNLDLVRYFRNLDIKGEEDDRPLSFRDEENFWDPRPHFDRWIVHNTQAADRIYEEGFRYGMHFGKLASSWGSYDKPSDRIGGTVAFGTPIEDAKPLDDDTDLIWGSNWIDCGGSIVCKVSGVTAYHRDDREDQVMFDINSPKGCFWIRNTGFRSRCKGMFQMDDDSDDIGVPDSYEVIGKNPDRPLCKGTYERCIRWCRDNGDAYAHMMKRWKSPGNTAKTESMMAGKSNPLCEGMTPGNLDLVKYFRGFDPSGDEYSDADEDVFEEPRPHFDRWVVHSSDNAQEIYGQGFQYGADTGSLAYTDRHGKGKYAFATPIENARPPLIPESGQGITARLPYCDTIDLGGSIVFRTSGVAAYHRDDRENEVVFDRESPEGCFWIRNIHYNAWKTDTVDDFMDHLPVDAYEVIGENPGRPLCKGTYSRCLRWCRENGDAYAHMMKRWKSRGNIVKTESMMAGNSSSLCEADTGDTRNGSAWDTVERIHVYHAADPRMDMDINLDSLWATRQKDSATREDVIGRFIADAGDFNKWLATSEDGDAFITSASIKFKGDPEAITVDIPCPGGVEDLVSSSRNSLQESIGTSGSPEIPGSFCPTTGVQAKVDAKLRQLGIVVDWSTYEPSRNRSWASQGMPSGTAKAYTVPEAEKAGSYTTYNRRTICFYVSVSELARTPVDMYDVDTSMGSDYREIGVDTKFVPPGEPVGKQGDL